MPRITMRKVEMPTDRLEVEGEITEWLHCGKCRFNEFKLNRTVGVKGWFLGCSDCGASMWTEDFKSFYEGPDKPVYYRDLDD
jgi:hypothetical protein